MKKNAWKIILIIAAIATSIVYLYPTFQLKTLSGDQRLSMSEDQLDRLHKKAVKLGLDLQGGMHLVMRVDLSELPKDEARDAVDRAMEIIRNRIDQFGVSEPLIQKEGKNRIVVELPGLQDPERAKRLIGRTALLEFKLLRSTDDVASVLADIDKALAAGRPATQDTARTEPLFEEFAAEDTLAASRPFSSLLIGYGRSYDLAARGDHVRRVKKLLEDPKVQEAIPRDSEFLWSSRPEVVSDEGKAKEIYRLYYLKSKPEMTGALVRDARPRMGTELTAGQAVIDFITTDDGVKKFRQITGAHVGDRLGIVLDNKVYSAPVIRSKIPDGRSVIEGMASMEEAKDLAIVLRAGALPAPVDILEERTVGPSLGSDSIRMGVRAAAIGLALVMLFMVLYYGASGLLADLALILNMLFLMGVLAGFGLTLTLPGIAGIILTVGMAVDANVLIFERIREELRSGKTVRLAIDAGYSRALGTILDANVTTLITGVVLYQFGTSAIRGFALTLCIGIVSSLFTALVVTRVIYDLVTGKWTIEKLSIGKLQPFLGTRIPFIKVRKIGYVASVALIGVGLVSLAIHSGPRLGVDFKGGTLLELRFDPPVGVHEVRGALSDLAVGDQKLDLSKSEIREMGIKGSDILIRLHSLAGLEAEDIAESVRDRLRSAFPDRIPAGRSFEITPASLTAYEKLPDLQPYVEPLRSLVGRSYGDEEAFLATLEGLEGGQELVAHKDPILRYATLHGEDWVRREENVGPIVGTELKDKALKAILYAVLGIMFYISWRFGGKAFTALVLVVAVLLLTPLILVVKVPLAVVVALMFAVAMYVGWRMDLRFSDGAVIALLHDVLITVGLFSLLGKEITLSIVAALLTIVGYSLNDTIVIFDRIRENLRSQKVEPYAHVVNRSVNETLSRTLITSLTTLFVLVVLFLFGGEVIHDFAFALMVGVLVGTYSSVFVASPLLVALQAKAEARGRAARGPANR